MLKRKLSHTFTISPVFKRENHETDESYYKSLVEYLEDEIQKFLLEKIKPEGQKILKQRGYKKPFTLYWKDKQMQICGGDAESFSYMNTKKGDGIWSGVNGDPKHFWTHSLKYHSHLVFFNFVYQCGPFVAERSPKQEKEVYTEEEMQRYVISFHLQKKKGTNNVNMFDLEIEKERWFRVSQKKIEL